MCTIVRSQSDECATATVISPVGFSTSCSNVVSATTLGATASPLPAGCGVGSDDDVWYRFTASSATTIIRFSNIRNTSTAASEALFFALYEGSCPSATTSFYCSSAIFLSGYRVVQGLTPGTEYYLRTWSNGTTARINFGLCVQSAPTAPANDDCAGAIAISTQPFGTSCTSPVAGNTTSATASTPSSPCAAVDENDDVWYSFTASSSSIILRFSNVVHTIDGSTGSLGYALYNNTCPVGTTTVSCESFSGFGNGYQIIDGLTSGTTYLLRLFSTNANNFISFNFCIQDVPAAPVNDECNSAINITTQPFGDNCTASVVANTMGSTASASSPSCAGGDSNDDIWYSFTANSASVILRFSNVLHTIDGSTGSLGYALYNNTCPSSPVAQSCAAFVGFGSGYRIIEGLTPGTTYLLRLFSSNGNNYISFNFCVQDVPAAPVNDHCANAITVATQPFGSSCSATVSANTTGATLSSPVSSCTGTESNDDIWYRFTASSASIIIRFNNLVQTNEGSTGSLGYALYNSACPASTAAVSCSNFIGFGGGYRVIDGLIAGNTYYLRLYSSGANNYMSFDFCIQDVPPSPVNNECANAVAIATQPYGTGCSTSIDAATTGATMSSPATSCSSVDINDDIWYSFTANSASVILRFANATDVVTGNFANLGYALYNNTCPASTTSLSCNINIGFGGGYEIIEGLIPGNTYYLRLFSTGVNNYMSFNFCVQDVPAPPANNECVVAVTVPVVLSGGACFDNTANTTGATRSANSAGCIVVVQDNDDTWYRFVATGSSAVLRFSNVENTVTGATAGLGYALYNNCPASAASIACDDLAGQGSGSVLFAGLVAGNTYYVRLFGSMRNDYVRFNFCIQDPLAVLPLKFISFNGNASSQGNLLKWIVAKDMEIQKLVVERSIDGNVFTAIAEKTRNQFIREGTDEWEYQYADNQLSSSLYHYRIRMEDVNGQQLYSTIIRISKQGVPRMITLYPNPANEWVRVELKGNNRQSGAISIIDMNGRIIKRQTFSPAQAFAMLDIRTLSKGVYRMMIYSGDEMEHTAFIKQ